MTEPAVHPRRAVVTGGGTGLGAAIAERFAADGDDVVIVGRRPDVLVATAERLNARLGRTAVTTHACDLAEASQVEDLAAAVAEDGPVDVLVANAGGGSTRAGADLAETARLTTDLFTLNVLTAVLTIEAFRPHLRRPGARVLTMSSIAGVRGGGTYGAMKGAISSLTLGLAAELGPEGITVNALAPGFVPDTEFWQGRLSESAVDQRVRPTLLGRAGLPSEVADAAAYLAGPGAAWTTGQILQVNGGACLGRG
ncbi:SDR family NAD(P)-dependent oxidoreductase [Serinibacter arcticus]|uniref:3-oxoacyl-[acyl-carrier protein] reductase n=1 Tax=Serinibacter arcticus TaxID=1655435 RepID=A0A4Z1E8Z3_9MICO|nr:SDR family oxidoreductase [Serinibacter arcticus]TGO05911.1 3-oxoacyl-[acyl-carrier protein] reductase [Serinibacter arcticus]